MAYQHGASRTKMSPAARVEVIRLRAHAERQAREIRRLRGELYQIRAVRGAYTPYVDTLTPAQRAARPPLAHGDTPEIVEARKRAMQAEVDEFSKRNARRDCP